jgi:hypothetical protein
MLQRSPASRGRFIFSLAVTAPDGSRPAGVMAESRPVPVPLRRVLPAAVPEVAYKRLGVAEAMAGKRLGVARPVAGKRRTVAGAMADRPATVVARDGTLVREGARSALAGEARDGMSGSEPADGRSSAAGAMSGALRAEEQVAGGQWAQTRMRSASAIAAEAVERLMSAVSSD